MMSKYNSDRRHQTQVSRLLYKVRDRLGLSADRGRAVARPVEEDFSVGVPFAYDCATELQDPPIAVVIHLFHPELAASLQERLQHIRVPADLFLSTDTEAKAQTLAEVFANWGQGSLEIRLAPNRGRDIAPKFITFRDVYETHDLVLFLHSKKSPHWEEGSKWRTHLLDALLGSPATVESVLDAFRRLPSVGMIVPQHYRPLRALLGWTTNYSMASRLAGAMGFRAARHTLIDLPSGSMFWARSAALRPLLQLGLTPDDFPLETGQTEGTTAHAIERLLLYICERAGYSWLKISPLDQAAEAPTVVRIDSPWALETFLEEHAFSLLSVSGSGLTK